MATNSFDRKIELTDIDSLKKMIDVMETEPPEPLSRHPFSDRDRRKGELLLDKWLSHTRNFHHPQIFFNNTEYRPHLRQHSPHGTDDKKNRIFQICKLNQYKFDTIFPTAGVSFP